MKELVEITREPDPSSTRSSVQDITGQLSKQMRRLRNIPRQPSQRFSNIPRQPSEYLTQMMAPWPFAQWGLDILGHFSVGTRQMKFRVVGIDYFTKWVEVGPLVSITQQNVKNFVWKNIVCRFGVPKVLVSDHGRQFDNTPFKDFCAHFGIQNHYSSPAHPQANG